MADKQLMGDALFDQMMSTELTGDDLFNDIMGNLDQPKKTAAVIPLDAARDIREPEDFIENKQDSAVFKKPTQGKKTNNLNNFQFTPHKLEDQPFREVAAIRPERVKPTEPPYGRSDSGRPILTIEESLEKLNKEDYSVEKIYKDIGLTKLTEIENELNAIDPEALTTQKGVDDYNEIVKNYQAQVELINSRDIPLIIAGRKIESKLSEDIDTGRELNESEQKHLDKINKRIVSEKKRKYVTGKEIDIVTGDEFKGSFFTPAKGLYVGVTQSLLGGTQSESLAQINRNVASGSKQALRDIPRGKLIEDYTDDELRTIAFDILENSRLFKDTPNDNKERQATAWIEKWRQEKGERWGYYDKMSGSFKIIRKNPEDKNLQETIKTTKWKEKITAESNININKLLSDVQQTYADALDKITPDEWEQEMSSVMGQSISFDRFFKDPLGQINTIATGLANQSALLARMYALHAIPYMGKYLSYADMTALEAGSLLEWAKEIGEKEFGKGTEEYDVWMNMATKESIKHGSVAAIFEETGYALGAGGQAFRSLAGKKMSPTIIDKIIKDPQTARMVSRLLGVPVEGLEEFLQAGSLNLFAKATLEKYHKISPSDRTQHMLDNFDEVENKWESAKVGAIHSLFFGGGEVLYTNTRENITKANIEKKKERVNVLNSLLRGYKESVVNNDLENKELLKFSIDELAKDMNLENEVNESILEIDEITKIEGQEFLAKQPKPAVRIKEEKEFIQRDVELERFQEEIKDKTDDELEKMALDIISKEDYNKRSGEKVDAINEIQDSRRQKVEPVEDIKEDESEIKTEPKPAIARIDIAIEKDINKAEKLMDDLHNKFTEEQLDIPEHHAAMKKIKEFKDGKEETTTQEKVKPDEEKEEALLEEAEKHKKNLIEKNKEKIVLQPSITITPEMRESIPKGQAKFRGLIEVTAETTKDKEKTITDLKKTGKDIFGEDWVRIVSNIVTPEGKQALGKYQGSYIDIVVGRGNPGDTLLHESVHKAISEYLTPEEKSILYNTKKTEEEIAEFIVEYANAKAHGKALPVKGFSAKVRNIIGKLVEILNRLFGRTREINTLYDFYDSLLEGEFANRKSKYDTDAPLLPAAARLSTATNPDIRYRFDDKPLSFVSKPRTDKEIVKDIQKGRAKVQKIADENYFDQDELNQVIENVTEKAEFNNLNELELTNVIKALKSFKDVPESESFNKHLKYLEKIQLPQTSEIRRIKYQLRRVRALRNLTGGLSIKEANEKVMKLKAQLQVAAQAEHVSVRYTKEGTPILSVRAADIYVPQEFTDYDKFKDVGLIAGGGSTVVRMIQKMDGSLSRREKKKVKGGAGQLEQKVLWRTHDIMMQKIGYDNEKMAEAAKIFHKVRKHSDDDIAITDALRRITGDMNLGEAYNINEGIKPILIKKSYQLRKLYDDVIAEQNYARMMRNQDEIPFKDKYSPEILRDATIWERLKATISTDKEAEEFKDSAVLPDFVKPNKPFNPRELANKNAIPYEDQVKSAMELFERYLVTASKDIFNTTVIQNNKAFIQQLESLGFEKSARSLADWTAEAYAGIKPKLDRFLNLPPKAEKAMRKLNNLRNMAVFPANVAWSLRTQPLSIVNTITKYGYRNTGIGLVKYLYVNTAKSIGAKVKKTPFISPYNEYYSYVIKSMKTGRISRQDANNAIGQNLRIYKTWQDVLNDFSTIMTDNIEKLLTGTSIEAAYRLGRKSGLTGRALIHFASDAGGKTQSMYNKEDKPGILRALAVKTAAPYQTFTFEMVDNLKEWAGKTGTPPDTKMERIVQLLRFISSTTLIGLMFTPKGRDPKWTIESFMPFSEFWFTPWAKKYLKLIPYSRWWSASARKNYGEGTLAAPVDFMARMSEGFSNVVTDGNWRKLRNHLIVYLPGILGVPGGVQISRMADALIAYSKGGVYTKSGKLMFSVDTPDALIKSMLMGVWSSPGGIEYLEDHYGKTVVQELIGDQIKDEEQGRPMRSRTGDSEPMQMRSRNDD